MPDPSDFDFDAARRSLDEVGPTRDLWAEAERRAADGSVVPLSGDGLRGRRRPLTWLAVAAVSVLAAGTVGVLASQDESTDPQVDTGTGLESGTRVTVGEPPGCRFGLTGDPVELEMGPADPPIFGSGDQEPDQTVAHLDLGEQVAEFYVPGMILTDLVGERVEQVELERGTANIWFGGEFVQVRWFPSDAVMPCDSFTVTVAGGTEDGNRHVAVDLADRMVLASEIDAPSLRQTEWALERSTVGGEPTAGDGSLFTFRQNDVQWTDGCNEFGASFEQDLRGRLVVGGDDPPTEITSTQVSCDPTPTTDAILAVMSAGVIDVGYDGELLVLSAHDVVLTLRPIGDGGEATTTTTSVDPPSGGGEAYAIWPITYPGQPTGDVVGSLETTADTALSFARSELGWFDAEVTDGEPSEDGREGGAVHLVESEETGGAVTVWVAPGDGADGFVVYRLDVPGRTSASPSGDAVFVQGLTARVSVSPAPAGTAETSVKLTYGDDALGGGALDEDIRLDSRPTVPGRVLVFFADSEHRILSVWGIALPAGDYATDNDPGRAR